LAKLGWLAREQGVVVTGDIGVGKTTLVRTLVGGLDPAVLTVANLVSAARCRRLARAAASRSAWRRPKPTWTGRGPTRRRSLIRFLHALEKRGARAALIIDEAQNLPRAALDRLLVSPTQYPQAWAGRCGWSRRPNSPMLDGEGCAALRPLIRGMCHLGPMDRGEPAPTSGTARQGGLERQPALRARRFRRDLPLDAFRAESTSV
jgi:hypothetical protein